MTAPSSTPRGERAGRPGITWQTELVRTEQHVDDDTRDPAPPNRATRRAIKRAARRKNVTDQPTTETELAQLRNRLRLAHQARRAKEHQLDDIRRALCDAGFMQDDDPYSHADLADVIRQTAPAAFDGRADSNTRPKAAAKPEPAAGGCSAPGPRTEPNNHSPA